MKQKENKKDLVKWIS